MARKEIDIEQYIQKLPKRAQVYIGGLRRMVDQLTVRLEAMEGQRTRVSWRLYTLMENQVHHIPDDAVVEFEFAPHLYVRVRMEEKPDDGGYVLSVISNGGRMVVYPYAVNRAEIGLLLRG